MTKSIPQRVLSLAVVTSVAFASLPAAAAAPGKKGKRAAAAKATDGRTIALLRFSGAAGADMRSSIQLQLKEKSFSVKSVALELGDAAKKVKCRDEPTSEDCLAAIGKWLNANPKTAADFIVYGNVGKGPGATADIGVYDVGKGTMVERYDTRMSEQDLILPIVLPQEITEDLEHHLEPPPPPTEDEQKIIAELDEPEKTPEEIAAERKALEDAQAAAAAAQQDAVIDTSDIEVDLEADFEDFCREGPRKKRESRDDPKDLRPKCSAGPFWGYWQPRAWVALTLTAGTAVATGVFYGMALAARGPYKDAVDELEAFEDAVGGDPSTDPTRQCMGDVCYDALATEVSKTGSVMRRRAIVGDVLLGSTVLLGGVLAIIIFQDRTDAKNYIKQEKGLRAISSTLRVAPIISKETKGLGLGFRF